MPETSELVVYAALAFLVLFLLALFGGFWHTCIALTCSQPGKKMRNVFSLSGVYEDTERYTDEGRAQGKAHTFYMTFFFSLMVLLFFGFLFYILYFSENVPLRLKAVIAPSLTGLMLMYVSYISLLRSPEARATRGLKYFFRPIKKKTTLFKAAKPWERFVFFTGLLLFLATPLTAWFIMA